MPAWRDYLVRTKIEQATAAAAPHRVALDRACREGRLEGAGHDELGLDPPDQWQSEHVTAIVAAGEGPKAGTVTLTLADVGGDIEPGGRLVLAGTCVAGRMIWTAGGGGRSRQVPARASLRSRAPVVAASGMDAG